MKRHVVIFVVLLVLAGCTTDRDPGDLFAPNEVGILVVDATLIVGDTYPRVLLSRTLAPDGPFSESAAAVSGATVSIRSDAGTASYIEYEPGVYLPVTYTRRIAPTTTYHLEVRTAEGELLTASTTTPAAFVMDGWFLLDENDGTIIRRLSTFAEFGDSLYKQPQNTLVYQQGLLEGRFDRGDYVAFQVGLWSLDEDSPFLIDPDFFEEEDFDDLNRRIASPPFDAPDGFVRLPWFAIYFEGRYLISVFAIDRNWYDLARSLPEFSGGGPGFGGQAGDDFERPIFHVEGGIGLFGSAAVDVIGFTVVPGN